MRGVILAGGTGTRLDPLTRVINKHLLPVYDRPMIHFALEQLADAGIDTITLVTGGDHAGEFLRLLGTGRSFGLRHLDYAYQDRPGGIAEALGLCSSFGDAEPIAVLLGDNIFESSIASIVARFRSDPHGACLVLAAVEDPSSYGVAVMEGDRLVGIIEKPSDPPSDLAVTGLYLYDSRVFDIVKELRPSARGELEITDVNNRYLELGALRYERIHGYWVDCGTSIAALFRAAQLVAERGANNPTP